MNITPWSYSRLKSFEQCPKQFYHLKVVKDYEEKQSSAMFYGNEFHKAAENYIKIGEPLPPKFLYSKPVLDSLKTKKGDKLCEYRMGLTEDLKPCGFYDKTAWYRGICDLIILNADDRLAWVVDYKTSKNTKYADKGQLELMALCVFKHFPVVEKIRAGLLFVVCEELVKENYKHSTASSLWSKWYTGFDRMKKAYETDVWNANPSGLCKQHCAVTECVYNGRN